MPPRLRVFYSLLTAGLLLIPLVALYSELAKRADIWWTPGPMALSLAESRDRVEIYARGRPLNTLLEQNQVSIADGARSNVLSAQEIRLRFNNWERVRVQRLPLLLLYAAACGAGAALLLVIATGRLAYRGEAVAA
jgi:hypothetical protein